MQAEMLDSMVSSNSQSLSNASASSAMKLFENPLFRVRVIMRCSDPWFVAKDVATSIEHKDVTTMCRVCRDKDVAVISGKEYSADLAEYSEGRGNPNLTVISESGLYRILAKCNLPKCEPFESWVFDEVLPSIRKTGGYGIRTVDDMINDPDTAIRLLTQLKILRLQNDQLAMERDEAIRTKAQIGSNREATAMNTASQKSKECEKLREQIGDSKTYKAAKSIPWLSEYFDTRNDGLYISLASKLNKIEASMPPKFAHTKIENSQYGQINAYHVAVIERLHEIVRETIPVDEKFMAKYRKDVSPKTKNA